MYPRYLIQNISALCPENIFNVFVWLSEQTGVSRLIITVDKPRVLQWIASRTVITLFNQNTKYFYLYYYYYFILYLYYIYFYFIIYKNRNRSEKNLKIFKHKMFLLTPSIVTLAILTPPFLFIFLSRSSGLKGSSGTVQNNPITFENF
jgi:hypothetical protein